MPKADCHNRWTVGEHWADCKPLVLRTALHGLEEGTVSALTKLKAALLGCFLEVELGWAE